jgi:hypothetical protein
MMIRGFRESDRAAVIDLWRRNELTRPWNDPDSDETVSMGKRLIADPGPE